MSNAIPPSVVYPSPNEWPQTLQSITGIQKGATTTVTVPSHGFTSEDENVTTIDFLQVEGMIQINHQPGRIIQVLDTDNFVVDINSTNYYEYISGGVINTVTGHPPIQQSSFQYFNTPFQNVY